MTDAQPIGGDMAHFPENALTILQARYFKKNAAGELIEKSPEQLFERVAAHIAAVEKSAEQQKKWKAKVMNKKAK